MGLIYFEKNRIFCFCDHIGRHLGFLSLPSVMPIYAGSFRNYKYYRTFWYITHLVLRGGPGSQIFCPDCHPTISEPEFYGDLVYKFKKIVGRADFSDQFRKIIVRYKRIGYNINIMRQSACLVFNPITVNNFASLFNCTPVGRASDSMMAPK